MTTFTRIRRIAAIGIALALAAIPTSSAFAGASAGAVGALNVTYAIDSNGENITEIHGIWSKYNASVPPVIIGNEVGDNWIVYLPDYYEILDPVVEPFKTVYAPDGTLQAKAMHGYYICHVLTYSGNEIILTLHKTQDSPSDNSFNCELIGMTWNNGDGKGIDVSHIWDGEHRESSTWFYFDDEGNLVTL